MTEHTATVSRTALISALEMINKVAIKKATIPILQCATFKWDGVGKLTIMATDLDQVSVITVPAAVDAGLNFCASPHVMLKYLKTCADDMVRIAVNGTGHVSVGDISIGTLPVENMPATLISAENPTVCTFQMDSKTLLHTLKRTKIAISTEETRYYLNGIYMNAGILTDTKENVLRFVATDGHRLVTCDVPQPKGFVKRGDRWGGCIIPRLTVENLIFALQRTVKRGNSHTQVWVRNLSIEFEIDGPQQQLHSKLIDGTFPDYQRVIPMEFTHTVTVPREMLLDAVKSAGQVLEKGLYAVRSEIDAGVIRLSAGRNDDGSFKFKRSLANASVKREANVSPGPVVLGFNWRYMVDALSVLQGERVRLCLNDDSLDAQKNSRPKPDYVPYPITITTDDTRDGDLFQVLMPMRV